MATETKAERKEGKLTVRGLVHMSGRGDITFENSDFAGSKGHSHSLEGFELKLLGAPADLGIEYTSHASKVGDLPKQAGGTYLGSRGESRPLEGYTVWLTGAAAPRYDISYMAHLAGKGDTITYHNGQYCGTRGESRAIEGIRVWIDPVPTVHGTVHLSGVGDVAFTGSAFAGSKGKSQALEAITLTLSHAHGDLGLEYSCHAASVGDLPFVSSGRLLGSTGQSRPIEGFSVRLTGSSSSRFTVRYQCHQANRGDSAIAADGAYCGSKGESIRIEGIQVWIYRK